MSKPKEWTLGFENNENERPCDAARDAHNDGFNGPICRVQIKVVEKSAYDELENKLEVLEKSLKYAATRSDWDKSFFRALLSNINSDNTDKTSAEGD